MTAVVDELEVKARVDDPAALERTLLAAGATVTFRGAMSDRRYDRDAILEGRDEVLRLRVYRSADGSVPRGVLAWKGSVSVRGDYRRREELETAVGDPAAALALLERLGFSVSLRIDREITQFALGGAVLRLERYPAMDTLIEVEGEPAAIERAIRATGMPRDRFLPESLPFFVHEFERRTGRRAGLAR